PGQMPKKDPHRETKLAAARERTRLVREEQEKKIMAALQNWPRKYQESPKTPLVIPLDDQGIYVQVARLSPDGSKVLLGWWDKEKDGKPTKPLIWRPGRRVTRFHRPKEGR